MKQIPKHLLMKIALNLDISDISNFCQAGKFNAKLCDPKFDDFWRLLWTKKYGDMVKYLKPDQGDYYSFIKHLIVNEFFNKDKYQKIIFSIKNDHVNLFDFLFQDGKYDPKYTVKIFDKAVDFKRLKIVKYIVNKYNIPKDDLYHALLSAISGDGMNGPLIEFLIDQGPYHDMDDGSIVKWTVEHYYWNTDLTKTILKILLQKNYKIPIDDPLFDIYVSHEYDLFKILIPYSYQPSLRVLAELIIDQDKKGNYDNVKFLLDYKKKHNIH